MRKDHIYNVLIILLCTAIVVILYFKIFLKNRNMNFEIKTPEKINLSDFSNNKINLELILRKNEESYILVLEIDNCGSCITKGINELNSLRNQGKYCFALIVYDRPNEISGWAENYNFSPFYIITKLTYYKYFRFQYLPLIFTIKNGKIKILRYITF